MKFKHYLRVPVEFSVTSVRFSANDHAMIASTCARPRIWGALLRAAFFLIIDAFKVLLFGSAEARP